jgi:hypothetical protein
MISAMVSSATEREFEKGELKTQIPWEAAYARSTWFVPIQKQPITERFLADERTRAFSLVLERMPITWTSLFCAEWLALVAHTCADPEYRSVCLLDLLNQLILR